MDPAFRLIADTGVVTRQEILSFGMRDADITRSLRAGVLTRIRPGAYASSEDWARATPEARHLLLSTAVSRQFDGPMVLSHTSAVVAHALPVWGANLDTVHLTRESGPGRQESHVWHHRGRLQDEDVVELPSGLCATRQGRAVLEHGAVTSTESGLVAADAALHAGLDTAELQAAFERMERWPGTQRAQMIVRLADGASESPGETRTRFMFWLHGVPRPVLQYAVRDAEGRLVGRTDFAWPEHGLLGEFDGRVKYGGTGSSDQSPADVLFAEKRREDLLREVTGWRMIRLVWADLATPAATVRRVMQALERRAA